MNILQVAETNMRSLMLCATIAGTCKVEMIDRRIFLCNGVERMFFMNEKYGFGYRNLYSVAFVKFLTQSRVLGAKVERGDRKRFWEQFGDGKFSDEKYFKLVDGEFYKLGGEYYNLDARMKNLSLGSIEREKVYESIFGEMNTEQYLREKLFR